MIENEGLSCFSINQETKLLRQVNKNWTKNQTNNPDKETNIMKLQLEATLRQLIHDPHNIILWMQEKDFQD